MPHWPYIITALTAYLFGSIPTGFLAGKAKGIDMRLQGSGNIGATNVFRVLGKPAGYLVLFVDALKGFLAVVLIVSWYPELHERLSGISVTNGYSDNALREQLGIVAGVFAVLGHNFTCWLKFKGGKGIATSAGVLVAWVPWALLTIFAIWLIVFAATRYVSLSSICAAFALPFAVWLTGGGLLSGAKLTMILITGLLAALAIYKHRSNIQRLLNGTEHRFQRKAASSSASP